MRVLQNCPSGQGSVNVSTLLVSKRYNIGTMSNYGCELHATPIVSRIYGGQASACGEDLYPGFFGRHAGPRLPLPLYSNTLLYITRLGKATIYPAASMSLLSVFYWNRLGR